MTTEVKAPPSLTSRMWRALKLEDALYEEVEHDPTTNKQALYVIALVSIAQAIGRSAETVIVGRPFQNIIATGVFGFIETAIGLAIWSYILYYIGTKIFKGVATPQEVWRTTGFARSPGVFFIIPFIGLIVNIWILIAYIKASRHALDISLGKTILAAIVSALPFLIIQGIVVLLLAQLL